MVGMIDVVVIVLYFLFILTIGVISYRRVKNEQDFSLAGRSLGYPLLIGAITATAIGSGATLGVGGLSYNIGIASLWSVIAYALGLIGFAFIARVIRRIKLWTIPEVLRERYGNTTRIVVAIFLMLGLIALFGVQVAALGTVFTVIGDVFGVTYGTAVLIAGGVMIAYTFAGGMFAIAYTEIVQAFLLLSVLGIMMPLFVFGDTPLATVAAGVPEKMFDFMRGAPVHTMIGWFLTLLPICFIDVSLWQRASSARNEGVAVKSILVSTVLYFGYSVAIILVGIAGFYHYPDLVKTYGTSDVVIPVIIGKHLPVVAVGLSLAAILAVVMSTAASVLMVAGMTGSTDIARIFKPNMNERQGLLVARLSVLVIGILGVSFSLLMRGIFDMMLLAFALFISGAFVPVMAALFWKKATPRGAVFSMIGGMIVVVALYGLNKPYNIEPIFGALVISSVLMYVVSIITYKPGITSKRLADR
ncbi:MAG: hypothetical protein QM472_11285 [Spirochaetota bacterium]|nr:hypothetical protein [Spirochaetota bacterium]HPI15508.1 hypothetical protein [Spirochaetota bacterium]HPV98954.1 hypothetical protein [Spirochaetota bacterium]